MTRLRTILAAMLLGVLCWPLAAVAQPAPGLAYWFFQIKDERDQAVTASAAKCQVYTASTRTNATIYSDRALATAITQPFAADSSGICSWYMSTSTALDVNVWTNRGRGFFAGMTVNDHVARIGLQGSDKIVRLPFSTDAALVNTGFTIPVGAIVRDVLIEVTTASTTGHLTIGLLTGNTAGFCGGGVTVVGDTPTFGKSLEYAGWHQCHAVLTAATVGWLDRYISAFHSGVYLSRGAIGGTLTHAGSYIKYPYIANAAANVSYMTKGTVAGFFYLLMSELGAETP